MGTSGFSKGILAGLVLCFGAASLLAASPKMWNGFVAVNVVAGLTVVLLWWRGDVTVRTVVAFALLFRLFYIWLPPVLSDDAYRYIWVVVTRQAEIKTDRFSVTDVEVAVRLRREARNDPSTVLVVAQIVFDDSTDEV